MAKRSGQSSLEFILMLSLLTGIGIYLMVRMIGPDGKSGAIETMQRQTTQEIANDPD